MHNYLKNKEYLKDNGKVNAAKVLESYIKKNYVDLHESIIQYSKEHNLPLKPFSSLIWLYMKNIKSIPVCIKCKSKKTKWLNIKKGFQLYCSIKCASSSKYTKDKIKQTNLEKYGVENVFQSDIIKEKKNKTMTSKYGNKHALNNLEIKKKFKETCLNKYGAEYYSKINEYHIKTKQTNLDKYGVEYASQSEKIKERTKKTNLEKYGVEYFFQTEEFIRHNKIKNAEYKNNLKLNNLIKLGIKKELIISIDKEYVNIKCYKCNKVFNDNYFFIWQRLHINKINPCTNCNPRQIPSHKEIELLNFIKDNYTGEIISNDRTILKGQELDIYLPNLGLAFEFNRLYWHNELYKEKKYHLNKTEYCLKKDIQLIHIYEDDWLYKQDIVKSRILNLLGKSEKIYARKCIVKEVDSKDTRKFLVENHIQGFVGSKVKLGLYYKIPGTETEELISLMTFGGLRKNLGSVSKEGSWELLRFCNKLNTSVVGGASKLFKYFVRNYSPKEVISYADRSWSKGSLYENLYFKKVKETGANYYYVVNGIRENRYKYRKNELVKEGYDSKMTEHEIMLSRNIYRIYDSGSYKFTYNLNNSH